MTDHRLVNSLSKISALSLLFLAVSIPLAAQEVSAGLTGRVTDPSGASVANAKVTAKDLDRGTDWPTTTQADGIYAFPRIPVGRYSLTVEATGFKIYKNSEFTLELNQRGRIDVALQVGAITESVTIDSAAPLLQADTTQVGSVINDTTIVNMPLVTRNPVALTLLAPGVMTPDPASFNNGVRGAGGGRPYVNGNREQANNFLLDGVDNNQISDNLTAYQPNLDAIEEFKMITSNASAEFGNFQGGIVNVVIKSGTNKFHGNVFEDFRNDIFNAGNWGRNWQGLSRQPLRWNEFGGTYGGPIIKDKLFFFADYQGLRQAVPSSLLSTTVMPLAWRQGDFSSLLDTTKTGKAPIQLYNPYNIVNGLRQPFAGNIIPANLLSPAATKLLNNLSLYPAPQTSSFTTPNYQYAGASYINTDQGDMKLDWRPNDKDYFSARYSKGRQDQPSVNSFPLFYGSFNESPFQNGVINWTRTISPSLVNEARVGVNNILYANGGADKGLGNIATSVGIGAAGSGLLALGSAVNGGPGFAYVAGLGNANIGAQQVFANTTYHYADNFTIIKGRHMIKVGGQIMRQDLNTFYSGNGGRTGYINFGGRFTAQNPTSPTGTQIGEADFLLGLPNDIGRGLSTGTWGQRGTIYGFYGQDDWRITNNLTLNLGLRWEYHAPWYEVEDRQANYSPFTGTLELPGNTTCPTTVNCVNGQSRALYNPYKKDFQPRLGFAYTPDFLHHKGVIRGGYTISSFLEGTGTNLRLPLNPPFNSEYSALYNTSAFSLPGSTLDQGLSTLVQNNPFKNATIRLWDPNVRPAEVQQWNFTAEYQLPASNVLTVGYVGQHGTHLMVATPYLQNQLVNGTVVPGPYLSGNPAVRSVISQISGTETNGNQKYNSLQTTLKKRFGFGAEYQVSYTWSHGMSDSIGYYGAGGQSGSQSAYVQNLYDRKDEWANSFFDVQHAIVISGVYELPFGKGKKFGSNANRAVDAVLGGWQLGTIISGHTGFPLTIKVSPDPSGTGARSFRADTNGQKPNDPHNIGPGVSFLDPSTYFVPPSGTFGDTSPGVVRGPGMSRTDLSLGKKFHITESKYFELRGEAFNVGNHPIFLSPASQTITSPLFGQIRSSQGERNMQVVGKFYF